MITDDPRGPTKVRIDRRMKVGMDLGVQMVPAWQMAIELELTQQDAERRRLSEAVERLSQRLTWAAGLVVGLVLWRVVELVN